MDNDILTTFTVEAVAQDPPRMSRVAVAWALTWRYVAFGIFATMTSLYGLCYAAWSLVLDAFDEHPTKAITFLLTALLLGASVAFLGCGWLLGLIASR